MYIKYISGADTICIEPLKLEVSKHDNGYMYTNNGNPIKFSIMGNAVSIIPEEEHIYLMERIISSVAHESPLIDVADKNLLITSETLTAMAATRSNAARRGAN